MIYEDKGAEIGALVDRKNVAYGDSFRQTDQILKILFPFGVPVEKYKDLLAMTRIIDKLFRIATDKKAFNEDPWKDIAGYAILKASEEEK